MKRDMDLIRKMALALEAAPKGYAPDELELEDDYSEEQIAYHAYLMIDGGLATGIDTAHMGSSGPSAQLTALTWRGHEFIDVARDETRWKKVMGTVQQKSGSVTMDVLTELLKTLMRNTLGMP